MAFKNQSGLSLIIMEEELHAQIPKKIEISNASISF